MQSLNEKTWAQLPAFGDGAPLCIETTNSSIDGIRLIDDGERSVPYITRSDANNGFARFVSTKNYEFGSDDGGCITVGLDTQTAFYQPHKFVTGQNIQVITGKSLNEDVAQFMVPILRQQMTAKFNWGGNGATLGRMKRLTVMLPVTDSGELDYAYMAEYAQQKRDTMLAKYRTYVEARIAELGEVAEIPALDEKEWKPFSIVDLFSSIIPGKGKGLNHLKKVCADGVNYIGATNRNNGVLCYVEEDTYSRPMILEGNCIGFIKNGDGSAGFAIYKAEQFISTSDVLYGYADWLNKFTGLFFVVAQDMIEHKYSHGYKRNKEHLAGDKVMLPVTDSGEPDYEYMEQYSKNMMLRKYQQYLTFLQQRSDAR
jgi:hypothetical protein